ncbi:hypothetical protein CJD36_004450 [Flavipsychrobacter stenotrophus]|uniref:Uncharacterized protein n=1 Tax=Flavipsychrobacter stenotrophus TaxID=2077091 RepID=A0A2S7T1C9_9BACT|nr:hypothetical protein CJD36_004450 [Flavipsychrobacter stenotrophus]
MFASSQSKDGKDVLKNILAGLKDVSRIKYDYTVSFIFPDNSKQKLNGHVYVDNNRHELYNDNDLQTIIYTDKWSYQADHTEKEIAIRNNEKHLSKEYRHEMEKQMFQNNALSVFLDSVVMKRALMKSYKKSNDTINIELSFPANYAIRSIQLGYDEGHKKLFRYSMVTFFPEQGSAPGNKQGTTNTIACSHFSDADASVEYGIDNFFVVNNSKLTLKKYNSYKLSSKL